MTYKVPLIGVLIGFACGPALGYALNFIGSGSIVSEIGYVYLVILLGIFSKVIELLGLVAKDVSNFLALSVIFYVCIGVVLAVLGYQLNTLGYRWNFRTDSLRKTKTNIK
jgi:hypothetical protein